MGSKADTPHLPNPSKKQSSSVGTGGHRFEKAPNRVLAKNLTSYKSYRNHLDLIKYTGRILTIALCLPHLSQAIELKGVLEANRLISAAGQQPDQVMVTPSKRCGTGTEELTLIYKDTTAEVAKQLAETLVISDPAFKPCDTHAVHDLDGAFKMIFSYVIPKHKTLALQESRPSGQFVLDHWITDIRTAAAKAPRSPASLKQKKLFENITIENLNDLVKLENIELHTFSNLDSPYRDPKVERDIGIDKTPLKTRDLSIPLLHFTLASTDVNFEPQEFPYKEFLISNVKMSDALKGSLDAVMEMVKREDWIRASAANDILLSSKLGKEYKALGFFVPALIGHLRISSAKTEEGLDNRLFAGGINVWREALLTQAVRHEKANPFLDFMFLESLRYLYNEKDYYTGLALIDESKSIKWSPAVLERTDYLQGVALLALGMRQKAKDAFANYLETRKKLNIRDIADRRLMPSAAFRFADVDFAREDYALALSNYEKAMAYLPGSKKVNLEGYLYPRSLVAFPFVLLNMAEAHIRMGDYAKALKRLRALIAFDVAGQNQGVALYRVGEILSKLGSDKSRVLSIFRECEYRYTGRLSGNLCELRSAAMDPQFEERRYWPRLEATFAKFEEPSKLSENISLEENDRKVYSSIVKSNFYMERGKPLVALGTLDSTRDLEASAYLRNWNYEFSGVAFLGVLREELSDGDQRAVVEAYEKRRKNQLLFTERAGIALAVAQAYADQSLWPEARRAQERAEQIKEIISRTKPRRYDYTPVEWAYLNAKISVGLFDEGKLSRSDTESSIKRLDDAHMPSLLLLIGFAQKANNTALEINGWKRLSQISKLDWPQVRSYSSALLKAGKDKELRTLLEEGVATWFYEKDKLLDSAKSNAASPGSVLLLRLAEARSKDGAKDSALRVYNYLINLDAKNLEASTPKEMILYSMGKVLVSKKDYESARRTFDAATELAPTSVWGRLAATESQDLVSKRSQAQAR